MSRVRLWLRLFIGSAILVASYTNAFLQRVMNSKKSHTIPVDRIAAVQLLLVSKSSTRSNSDDKNDDAQLMNKYNFSTLESIAEEWTAVVKAGSSLQPAGIFMEPRNTMANFADLVTVRFPRHKTGGLGLELLELAGGREDGRGITIIKAVVPGGPTDGLGILPGDTLVDITIESIKPLTKGEESVTVNSVELECLGYDETVAAIRSLPPPRDDSTQETIIVCVKRLRRRPKVIVNLQYPEDNKDNNQKQKKTKTETIELFCGENLRRGMLVRGIKLNDPLARRFDSGGSGDCGADGTCATCAVAVTKGADLLSPPTAMEQQLFQDRVTWRMSCKAKVGMREGELNIRVNPRQWD